MNTTEKPEFQPVKAIHDGGTGVPVPMYHMTYRGETLHIFGMGDARKALDYLAERGPGWACVAKINGAAHEVCRNR